MYVKKFEDLSKDDLGIAGGKGANLGELTQAGIPVPPGFVVTSKTYDKFMRDTGIFSKVMDILDQVDINNTKELQEALKLLSLMEFLLTLLKLTINYLKELEKKMVLM